MIGRVKSSDGRSRLRSSTLCDDATATAPHGTRRVLWCCHERGGRAVALSCDERFSRSAQRTEVRMAALLRGRSGSATRAARPPSPVVLPLPSLPPRQCHVVRDAIGQRNSHSAQLCMYSYIPTSVLRSRHPCRPRTPLTTHVAQQHTSRPHFLPPPLNRSGSGGHARYVDTTTSLTANTPAVVVALPRGATNRAARRSAPIPLAPNPNLK